MRWSGTQIRTNIEAGDEGSTVAVRTHAEWRKRLKSVKVRLCDWLFRSILRDRQVLDYAATYFQLGPIKRRIYKVAHSTCVEGEAVEMDLQSLRLQIGFQTPLANVRIAMRQVVRGRLHS